METTNKMSLGYGTITARIQVPKGQGLWPAFWLKDADEETNPWPGSGEIDVLELPSTTTTIYSTLHGPIAGTTATQQAQVIGNLPDLSTGYHNFWVTHLPDKITFGVDNVTLGTLIPESLAPRIDLGLQPAHAGDPEPRGRRPLGRFTEKLDEVPGQDVRRLDPVGPGHLGLTGAGDRYRTVIIAASPAKRCGAESAIGEANALLEADFVACRTRRNPQAARRPRKVLGGAEYILSKASVGAGKLL